MTRRKPSAMERRRAGIIAIASLPVVALVGVIALKLILMTVFAQLSIAAFNDGRYEDAARWASFNLTANYIEPHKAHYDLGTAYLASELYIDARDELLTALQTAPVPDSCMVRVNLSLALEGLGDEANTKEYFAAAAQYYADAEAVLQQADPACASQSSGGGGGTDEKQSDLQSKSDQAQADADQQEQEEADAAPDPAEGEAPPEEQPAESDPIDQLGDRMDEAEDEREDQDSIDRAQENEDQFADKPW